MKIGVMNHPARDPIAEIHWIGEHAFDFVDFTLEPPAADPHDIDPRAITAALAQHGLGVVAHTAWFIPVSSPLAAIRKATVLELRRCLEAAQSIGATVMTSDGTFQILDINSNLAMTVPSPWRCFRLARNTC